MCLISEEQPETGIDSSVLTDVKVQGISSFTPGDMLRLEIEGSPEPVLFEPKTEAIFGRRDPATGAIPDIDLTPFAGYRMGVSRRHAAIRQNNEQSLDLWDLGSSNGTYLNGQRLNAHRPYRLHNGDEIRLGQMLIRVSFESGALKTRAPQEKPDEKPAVVAPDQAAVQPAASPQAEAAPAAQISDAQPAEAKDAVQPPADETSAVTDAAQAPDAPQAPPTEQPASPLAAAPADAATTPDNASPGKQPEAAAPEPQAQPQSAPEPASEATANADSSEEESPDSATSEDKKTTD